KAPLLHDLCLESTVCAANDHIGAYDDAPLATGGEPLTRDISRLEGVRWVGVQVGADKAPGLFDRGAGDAKLAGDLSEVVLAQRVKIILQEPAGDGRRLAPLLEALQLDQQALLQASRPNA